MDSLGEFSIGSDHPALPGHFPGQPIVPGVVLLDEVLAAIAVGYRLGAPLRLVRVKFVAPVLPGERVTVLGGPPANGAMRLTCVCGDRHVLAAVVQFDGPAPAP